MLYAALATPSIRRLQAAPGANRGVRSGITAFLDDVEPRFKNPWIPRLRRIAWTRDAAGFAVYVRRCLDRGGLPASAACIWIESPDAAANPPDTCLCAFKAFDPAAPDFGLEYPAVRIGQTAGTFTMAALSAAAAKLELSDDDPAAERRAQLLTALSYVYTALLILDCIPRLPARLLLSARAQLPVLFGFTQGDTDALGVLTPGGWKPVPTPTARQRRASDRRRALDPDKINPDKLGFDLDAYLAAGGDPSAKTSAGEPLLARAVFEGEVIKLIRAGANVNARARDGHVPLSTTNAENVRVLRRLLDAGANPNARVKGLPVLHWHLISGLARPSNVGLLLQRGADSTARDDDGNTALHALAQQTLFEPGRFAAVRSLLRTLRRHVNINRPNRKGLPPLWTPVLEFARQTNWMRRSPDQYREYSERHILDGGYGQDRVARMLLESGADPNTRTPRRLHALIPTGATPLMTRRYGRGILHAALLAHGADPTLRSAEGLTAIDYARRALRAAQRSHDRAGALPQGSPERRAVLLRCPESPRVIARLIRSMERAAARR